MKNLSLPCAAFWALFLSGCTSAPTPYTILKRTEGTGAKTVQVQVPPQASESDMQSWASTIESSEKVSGKGLMINFFNSSDTRTSNMVAFYTPGSFTATREQDRQQLQQEGD